MDIAELFDPSRLDDEPTLAETRPDYVAPAASAEPARITPYWADTCRGLRLYQGDALVLLRRLKADQFDLIFADPPYFLSNGGVTCKSGKMVSVDKGKWDRSEGIVGDHEFNITWLRECQRVLKPNGTLWVSGTSHNIYSVGFALQSLGYKILNDIAWYKVNPPPNLACRRFTHATETVIWAAKSEKSRYTFHYADMKQANGGKQMQSLWHIKPPAVREKRHGKHPTQKPEALLERILLAASNPDDLVLDPFCGSGTTGTVAARLARRFIGFDIEPVFLQIACARLSDGVKTTQTVFVFSDCILSQSPERKTDLQPRNDQPISDGIVPPSWAVIIADALSRLGGEGCLREINRVVELNPRTKTNHTWPNTVRRVVRQSAQFEPAGRGRYKLRTNR